MPFKTNRERFDEQFSGITLTLAFNPAWKNTTGYLDHLVTTKGLVEEGKFARTIDDHGRKVIVLGTALGNIVMFERFTGTEDKPCTVFVMNCPSVIKQMLGVSGALQVDDMDRIMGPSIGMSSFENVGCHIKRIRHEALAYEAEDEEVHLVG